MQLANFGRCVNVIHDITKRSLNIREVTIEGVQKDIGST